MSFNIKLSKIFKKICSMGLIATISFGGPFFNVMAVENPNEPAVSGEEESHEAESPEAESSIVNDTGAEPTNQVLGTLLGNTTMSKGTINNFSDLYVVTLKNGLSFNGLIQQLIESVTKNVTDDGTTLWLRVADSENALPNENAPWVKYENEDSIKNNDALKRKNVGTYYVYAYIQGGSNYNDYPPLPAATKITVDSNNMLQAEESFFAYRSVPDGMGFKEEATDFTVYSTFKLADGTASLTLDYTLSSDNEKIVTLPKDTQILLGNGEKWYLSDNVQVKIIS